MLEIIKAMALQIAREIRCCPSPLAFHGEAYQKHLEICSSCRSKHSETEDLTPWKDLANSLKPEQSDWVEPRVGQIRFVNNELSGWGSNSNFYQSPMVIILEEISGTNGFQVAQVYSDEALQGPDDIEFEELGGFAEPWNVYTLHKKHFGECLGEVSEELVVMIWNKFIDIIHDGESEATTLSSTDNEILKEFRSLEYLVSNHVAKQSVALLMEELESVTEPNTVSGISKWLGQTWNDIKEKLGDLVSDIFEPIWPGILITSSAAPEEKCSFNINQDEELTITYSWDKVSASLPAQLRIHWEGSFRLIGTLRVLFIEPTTNKILADIALGQKIEGDINLNEKKLGFDFENKKWALSIYMSDDIE